MASFCHQSIEPYVSSEDIDKGARWSTDIATELENSSYGILCVTKENLDAPWLNYEAGALSKTIDKSFVSPFLFKIKRSEVVDGPILQFQSTVFEKTDIKKLIKTINGACGTSKLTEERLESAFDTWYPKLEEELTSLKTETENTNTDKDVTSDTADILEEVLELTRINQKLLRNPEDSLTESINKIDMNVSDLRNFLAHSKDIYKRRYYRELPVIYDEIVNSNTGNKHINIKVFLGLIRSEYPWLYDISHEVINILKKSRSIKDKDQAIRNFMDITDIFMHNSEFYENRFNIEYVSEQLYSYFKTYIA